MKKILVIGVLFFLFLFLVSSLVFVIAEANETDDDNGGRISNGNQIEDRGRQGNGGEGAMVTHIKKRVNRTIFSPWQKRNESECPEGCACYGAVVFCKTETGKTMTIEAGRSGNVITITIEKIEADTELEIETEYGGAAQNKTKLKAKLSNGRKAEIKYMPDVAAQRALERLRLRVCSAERNCSIELKEVRVRNENKAAYEIQAQRHARILGLFKTKMQVRAQIDAENGEIIKIKKPWWAFLAYEPEE